MISSLRHGAVVAAACLFSLSPGIVLAAPAGQLALRWSELQPVLEGRRLSVHLTDGATVEGRYSNLQADALSIQVTKTSDPAKYPKGEARLARPTLALITVKRHVGWRGRTIGLIAGGGTGAGLGARYGYYADVAAGAAAGAVGIGYVVGWLIDHARARPEQVVRILPDGASR